MIYYTMHKRIKINTKSYLSEIGHPFGRGKLEIAPNGYSHTHIHTHTRSIVMPYHDNDRPQHTTEPDIDQKQQLMNGVLAVETCRI